MGKTMNAEEKHTPGPWEIGTSTRGYEVCTIHGVERQPTEDGLGQSWVYVYPPRVINGEWHWPDETEQLANARLIAAAPDLLAALTEIVMAAEGAGLDAKSRRKKALAAGLAAIAKAEGRS